LTFYIPQIFKENLVQQVKTEAQIQVMCDHHPFLVRGPFRWQNKRNLFIGNCVQSCSIESLKNVLDESRTFESVSVLRTAKWPTAIFIRHFRECGFYEPSYHTCLVSY
jgi:hypothetical protein